jgi:hypothetical protein
MALERARSTSTCCYPVVHRRSTVWYWTPTRFQKLRRRVPTLVHRCWLHRTCDCGAWTWLQVFFEYFAVILSIFKTYSTRGTIADVFNMQWLDFVEFANDIQVGSLLLQEMLRYHCGHAASPLLCVLSRGTSRS